MIHLSPNKNGIFSKKGASPLSKYILFFIYRKLIPICLQKTITTLTKLYQLMITLPKVLPLSLSLSLFLSVPYSLSLFLFLFLSHSRFLSLSLGPFLSLFLSLSFCSLYLFLSLSLSSSSSLFLDALWCCCRSIDISFYWEFFLFAL